MATGVTALFRYTKTVQTNYEKIKFRPTASVSLLETLAEITVAVYSGIAFAVIAIIPGVRNEPLLCS